MFALSRDSHQPDSNVETVILVSPKYGVSQLSGLRNSSVSGKSIFL